MLRIQEERGLEDADDEDNAQKELILKAFRVNLPPNRTNHVGSRNSGGAQVKSPSNIRQSTTAISNQSFVTVGRNITPSMPTTPDQATDEVASSRKSKNKILEYAASAVLAEIIEDYQHHSVLRPSASASKNGETDEDSKEHEKLEHGSVASSIERLVNPNQQNKGGSKVKLKAQVQLVQGDGTSKSGQYSIMKGAGAREAESVHKLQKVSQRSDSVFKDEFTMLKTKEFEVDFVAEKAKKDSLMDSSRNWSKQQRSKLNATLNSLHDLNESSVDSLEHQYNINIISKHPPHGQPLPATIKPRKAGKGKSPNPDLTSYLYNHPYPWASACEGLEQADNKDQRRNISMTEKFQIQYVNRVKKLKIKNSQRYVADEDLQRQLLQIAARPLEPPRLGDGRKPLTIYTDASPKPGSPLGAPEQLNILPAAIHPQTQKHDTNPLLMQRHDKKPIPAAAHAPGFANRIHVESRRPSQPISLQNQYTQCIERVTSTGQGLTLNTIFQDQGLGPPKPQESEDKEDKVQSKQSPFLSLKPTDKEIKYSSNREIKKKQSLDQSGNLALVATQDQKHAATRFNQERNSTKNKAESSTVSLASQHDHRDSNAIGGAQIQGTSNNQLILENSSQPSSGFVNVNLPRISQQSKHVDVAAINKISKKDLEPVKKQDELVDDLQAIVAQCSQNAATAVPRSRSRYQQPRFRYMQNIKTSYNKVRIKPLCGERRPNLLAAAKPLSFNEVFDMTQDDGDHPPSMFAHSSIFNARRKSLISDRLSKPKALPSLRQNSAEHDRSIDFPVQHDKGVAPHAGGRKVGTAGRNCFGGGLSGGRAKHWSYINSSHRKKNEAEREASAETKEELFPLDISQKVRHDGPRQSSLSARGGRSSRRGRSRATGQQSPEEQEADEDNEMKANQRSSKLQKIDVEADCAKTDETSLRQELHFSTEVISEAMLDCKTEGPRKIPPEDKTSISILDVIFHTGGVQLTNAIHSGILRKGQNKEVMNQENCEEDYPKIINVEIRENSQSNVSFSCLPSEPNLASRLKNGQNSTKNERRIRNGSVRPSEPDIQDKTTDPTVMTVLEEPTKDEKATTHLPHPQEALTLNLDKLLMNTASEALHQPARKLSQPCELTKDFDIGHQADPNHETDRGHWQTIGQHLHNLSSNVASTDGHNYSSRISPRLAQKKSNLGKPVKPSVLGERSQKSRPDTQSNSCALSNRFENFESFQQALNSVRQQAGKSEESARSKEKNKINDLMHNSQAVQGLLFKQLGISNGSKNQPINIQNLKDRKYSSFFQKQTLKAPRLAQKNPLNKIKVIDQIDVGGEAMKLLKVVPQGEQPLLESQCNQIKDVGLNPTDSAKSKEDTIETISQSRGRKKRFNTIQRDIYCNIYHLDPTGASEVKDADAGQEPEAESKAKAIPKRQVLQLTSLRNVERLLNDVEFKTLHPHDGGAAKALRKVQKQNFAKDKRTRGVRQVHLGGQIALIGNQTFQDVQTAPAEPMNATYQYEGSPGSRTIVAKQLPVFMNRRYSRQKTTSKQRKNTAQVQNPALRSNFYLRNLGAFSEFSHQANTTEQAGLNSARAHLNLAYPTTTAKRHNETAILSQRSRARATKNLVGKVHQMQSGYDDFINYVKKAKKQNARDRSPDEGGRAALPDAVDKDKDQRSHVGTQILPRNETGALSFDGFRGVFGSDQNLDMQDVLDEQGIGHADVEEMGAVHSGVVNSEEFHFLDGQIGIQNSSEHAQVILTNLSAEALKALKMQSCPQDLA